MTAEEEYFLGIAESVKSRSKDPNTKIGAVIANKEGYIVSTGYNGFPSKVKEYDDRWEKPTKYDYVSHAEANAIYAAARQGTSLRDCTIYAVGLLICQDCAKAIIQSGIRKVVCRGKVAQQWTASNDLAYLMFHEAGVTYYYEFYFDE